MRRFFLCGLCPPGQAVRTGASARTFIFFIFFALALSSYAQHDTTFYQKYNERLVFALYQSIVRQYDITMAQNIAADSAGLSSLHYYADANVVSGVELDFDKLSVSFGYKAVPPDDVAKKGKTYYMNYGASFGGSRWILEGAYRRYRGFYDINHTWMRDSDSVYVQNPSMKNEALKAKFLFFTNNKKFAYRSSYGCTYRQLKSAATWVLVSNLYYNSLITDTSFYPSFAQPFYGTLSDLNGLNVFGFSVGGGISFNLVILKRFFFNGTGLLGFESQWRKYRHFSGETADRNYLSMSGDARLSLGFNAKYFFMMISSTNDWTAYNSGQINVTHKFISFAFTMGYRFKFRPPGIYRKFQETKLYLML